jgi:ammonia channel protein AmtB
MQTQCCRFVHHSLLLLRATVLQNLHGMPGLLGGFIAGVAAFGQVAGVAPHGNAQLGFQILSLLCTVAIASTGGALVCALATGVCAV